MLVATPIHFRRIERGSGVRATVSRISNAGQEPVEVAVARVRSPYWIDVGRRNDQGEFIPLAAGAAIALAAGAEAELAVRLDTTHPEFPAARASEEVALEVASGEALVKIKVFLDEVSSARAPYDGVVAVDFGTTNTCYAWKDDEHFGSPKCSVEIPSVIFFKNVSDPDAPEVSIGSEAEHEVRDKTHLVSAYFTSMKRLLGGKPVRVIDPLGNTAWYAPERIVGFYLKAVLARLSGRDIGKPVQRVVATFPPSFDERRVAAVRKAFEHGLSARPGGSTVTIRLDEVSAAAFDHVYGKLYRAFRELKLEKRTTRILAIDVGGGTSDAVALDVELERRPRDATRISVKLLGATGERSFGGDEVTRALVEILQKKIALALAAKVAANGGTEHADPASSPLASVLRALAARPDDDDEEDDRRGRGASSAQARRRSPLANTLAALAAQEGETAVSPLVPAPAGLDRFACRDPEGLRRALSRIAGARDHLQRACEEGSSLAFVMGAELAAEAESLEDALETVVPVRPERLVDADPAREELVKALHVELRQEAERLKRRLVDRPTEELAPSGELTRLARYAGVDAAHFQRTVKVKLDELEAVIYPRIRDFVLRAKGLLERLEPLGPATTIVPQAEGVELVVDATALRRRPTRDAEGPAPSFDGRGRPQVLLCGNGSRLPAVRRAVREVLSVGDDELAWTPARAKPMVAQGAAEEEAQRRHFGGEFVEVEVDGFVERLPYALGLYHPDVESPGFKDGFFELFPRGAKPGETRIVGDEVPLVHSALERLKLYANDQDGAPPRLLGKVDLASDPVARVEPETQDEGSVRLRFELGADREVRVTDLARGTVHALEHAP
ncbi:MAG TPA: hypothetical protein VFF73_22050 [Planctomycetota bacterium]|nr:hypothetical protein [Planctomycetota bacterium]